MIIFFYTGLIVALTVFSFGFVDANFPLRPLPAVWQFVHSARPLSTAVYVAIVLSLFGFYLWVLWQVEKKNFDNRTIWKIIWVTVLVLFWAYPAFSYDIFNYIASAKVAFFYRENPYLVMPIEFPHEPMLAFLHAANKTALYGPAWIILTAIPHFLGFDTILLSIYAFKALIIGFYLLLARAIWYVSGKKPASLAFFALNPLVVIETLVSGHNDVVMMFLALTAFVMAKRQRFLVGLLLLILSVLIKFATIVLLPLVIYVWWQSRQSVKTNWSRIWQWAVYLEFSVFLISPLREEFYAWYFIWPLTFLSLLPRKKLLDFIAHSLSVGLLLRFAPFIYAGEWGRWVPLAKQILTAVPPIVATFLYGRQKKD